MSKTMWFYTSHFLIILNLIFLIYLSIAHTKFFTYTAHQNTMISNGVVSKVLYLSTVVTKLLIIWTLQTLYNWIIESYSCILALTLYDPVYCCHIAVYNGFINLYPYPQYISTHFLMYYPISLSFSVFVMDTNMWELSCCRLWLTFFDDYIFNNMLVRFGTLCFFT